MTRKRRNSSSSESEEQPSPKRAQPFSISDFELDYEPTGAEEPRTNPTYGQKGAFPGLGDDENGDELFYGPASSGLEYLRMVRTEAKGVPHILVGPKPNARTEEANQDRVGNGTVGGFYEDGAFIAAPEHNSSSTVSKDSTPDAQEAYYNSLRSRFQELRRFLHNTPPLAAIESLTSDHPISLPPNSAQAEQQWRFLLQQYEPQMVQLACMDLETVLEVIKLLKSLLAGIVRGRSRKKIERIGAWTWGLLARCNDAGELGSEEISELRELGKRAVGLLVGIRDRSGQVYGGEEERKEDGERYEEEEDGLIKEDSGSITGVQKTPGGNSATPMTGSFVERRDTTTEASADSGASAKVNSCVSELEQAKTILQKKLGATDQIQSDGTELQNGNGERDSIAEELPVPVTKQIAMLLDMIITVVGESYGQRDLLEFRDMWEGNVHEP